MREALGFLLFDMVEELRSACEWALFAQAHRADPKDCREGHLKLSQLWTLKLSHPESDRPGSQATVGMFRSHGPPCLHSIVAEDVIQDRIGLANIEACPSFYCHASIATVLFSGI
jgi:hypothetical protein